MNKQQFTALYNIQRRKNTFVDFFLSRWVRYQVYKENKATIHALIQQFERQLDKRIELQDNSDLEMMYYAVNRETFNYMSDWFEKHGWTIVCSVYNVNPLEWNFYVSLK